MINDKTKNLIFQLIFQTIYNFINILNHLFLKKL